MLESNVSVGDTCKEIGVTRHGSENAAKLDKTLAQWVGLLEHKEKVAVQPSNHTHFTVKVLPN